ncbi:hypothetical protein ADL00_15605 [Streptomyces sp. AS58]|uniref:Immunity protein 52 domain-containing protein n=1 Tax=Streptomyces cadmiisoli TaxID=2184053 RepID=A0A2Z4IY29_9ACTN|nr:MULTISPECIES: hypothetical protein [Streptomyces]AWW37831.1 hypothetical protein DN051_15185 [Streptomyces cadmiisoli]KOV67752.1 hypothetical protein ADL00_15605 [Streptomyces sp. AS58]
MRRVVRGFWGPRPEPVERLAERWSATLDGLVRLLPAAGQGGAASWTWRYAGPAGAVRPGSPPDTASLLDALRAARAAEDWSDRTGTGLRLVAEGVPGWKAELSGVAGGSPENLLQSIVIAVESPDDAEVPDAELLAAVAESWQPDFGDVTDDDVMDALEDDADFMVGEPSVGWVGFLSPGRAARVPDSSGIPRKELAGGGVLLHVADPGDTAAVVRAYAVLREAGALEPLPRPLDRAVL